MSSERETHPRDLSDCPVLTAVRFRHSGELVVGTLGEAHPSIVVRCGYQLKGWRALVDRMYFDRVSGEVLSPREAALRYLDFDDGFNCSSRFFERYAV
jgi:hypothetical protein